MINGTMRSQKNLKDKRWEMGSPGMGSLGDG